MRHFTHQDVTIPLAVLAAYGPSVSVFPKQTLNGGKESLKVISVLVLLPFF